MLCWTRTNNPHSCHRLTRLDSSHLTYFSSPTSLAGGGLLCTTMRWHWKKLRGSWVPFWMETSSCQPPNKSQSLGRDVHCNSMSFSLLDLTVYVLSWRLVHSWIMSEMYSVCRTVLPSGMPELLTYVSRSSRTPSQCNCVVLRSYWHMIIYSWPLLDLGFSISVPFAWFTKGWDTCWLLL